MLTKYLIIVVKLLWFCLWLRRGVEWGVRWGVGWKGFSCYDKFFLGGVGGWVDYKLVYGEPIPMMGHYIFNKILKGVYGGVGVGERLKVYKTNMPPKKAIIKRKKKRIVFILILKLVF